MEGWDKQSKQSSLVPRPLLPRSGSGGGGGGGVGSRELSLYFQTRGTEDDVSLVPSCSNIQWPGNNRLMKLYASNKSIV